MKNSEADKNVATLLIYNTVNVIWASWRFKHLTLISRLEMLNVTQAGDEGKQNSIQIS